MLPPSVTEEREWQSFLQDPSRRNLQYVFHLCQSLVIHDLRPLSKLFNVRVMTSREYAESLYQKYPLADDNKTFEAHLLYWITPLLFDKMCFIRQLIDDRHDSDIRSLKARRKRQGKPPRAYALRRMELLVLLSDLNFYTYFREMLDYELRKADPWSFSRGITTVQAKRNEDRAGALMRILYRTQYSKPIQMVVVGTKVSAQENSVPTKMQKTSETKERGHAA